MEDAVEQLENLARSVSACTRCEELAASRLRAVPGAGHPHCDVMIVSLCPSPADEASDSPAGQSSCDELTEFMPALAAGRGVVYTTTLVKCVPRTAGELRSPKAEECGACFDYLSRELSITTPHFILAVGEETTRYLLGKLFRDLPYAKDDTLELRIFDNPAFKVVPVATAADLRDRDAKDRKDYVERLRALAQRMGLTSA